MIPDTLQAVADYLKTCDIQLKSGVAIHPRTDSAVNKQVLVDALLSAQKWQIDRPDSNIDWYDVQIDGFYCNIKVSDLEQADNTNARGAICYFLTGQAPQTRHYRELFQSMKLLENEDEKRDYYFLIVNKKKLDDIFIVSLKCIADLTPNGNNLPFQANWGACRVPKHRTWQEGKEFLLRNYAQSVQKAVTALMSMQEIYPEFF